MADDNLITATTRVDTSGLSAGMDQANAVTRAGLTVLQTTYAQAASAVRAQTKIWIDADQQAREASAAGHAALAAQLQTIVAGERATLDTLAVKQNEVAASVDAYKNAMKAAVGPAEELAAASETAAVAIDKVSTSTRLASITARAFAQEAGLPMGRLLGTIATQSSALAPLLSAAFPYVAAAGLVDVLIHVAAEAYHAGENFLFLKDAEEQATEVGNSLASEAEKAIRHTTQLTIQALKDRSQYVKAARLEQQALLSESIKLPDLSKGENEKKLTGIINGIDPAEFEKLKDVYAEVISADLPARISAVNEGITRTQSELATIKASGFDPTGLSTHFGSQATTELQLYQQALEFLKDKQAEFAAAMGTAGAKVGEAQQKEVKAAQEATRKKIEALRAGDEGILGQIKLDGKASLEVIEEWIEMRIKAEAAYPARVRALQKELLTVEHQAHEALIRETRESGEAETKAQLEALQFEEKVFQDTIRAQEEHDALVKEANRKATEEAKKATAELRAEVEARAAIANELASAAKLPIERARTLSFDKSPEAERNYLIQLRAVDQQILQEKIRFQAQLIQIDSLNDPKKAQEDIRELARIQKQGQQQIYNDTTQILNLEQQHYQQFFSQLEQSSMRAFDAMITGQKGWQKQWENVWNQSLMFVVNTIFKELVEKFILTQSVMKAVQTATNAVMHALHLEAAVTNHEIDVSADTVTVVNAAGVAAANAYAAFAAVPPVALLMAADAFATTLSIGIPKLETGTNLVPRGGMYELHAGEAVVPKEYNPAAGGQTGGGRGHTFIYNAAPGASASQTKSDTDQAFAHFKKQARKFNR